MRLVQLVRLQTLVGLCRRSRGGKKFCLRLSLARLDCLTLFHVEKLGVPRL